MAMVQGLLLLLLLRACRGSVFFSETFETDPFEGGRWALSKAPKYALQAGEVRHLPSAGSSDKGLTLAAENRFYCFGTSFPSPLAPGTEGMVLQYDLRLEEPLTCGGAYVKLPRQEEGFALDDMTNETPYSIMFGPDKCGSSNKIHFIIQHRSPVTGEWEEKQFNETVAFPTDRLSHLYTLELLPTNEFRIHLDRKQVASGSLLTHMVPPVNPPAEIDDPTDLKPADWVDEPTVPSKKAAKPDDWDEEAPAMIADPDARMPAGWDEAAPAEVFDPSASRPADWEEDEDGAWEAPLIANPACATGCGPWKPPQIRNPNYRGKWTPPMVPNPSYKGEWAARRVANPGFFHDPSPAALHPMAGLAVEVWTVDAGIHFDNFFVGSSLEEAFEFADETFAPKHAAEKAVEEEEQRMQARSEIDAKVKEGGWLNYLQGSYMTLREYVRTADRRSLLMIFGLPVVALLSLLWLVVTAPPKRARRDANGAAAGGSSAAGEGAGAEPPVGDDSDAPKTELDKKDD